MNSRMEWTPPPRRDEGLDLVKIWDWIQASFWMIIIVAIVSVLFYLIWHFVSTEMTKMSKSACLFTFPAGGA